jgi:DNA-directed RNA polymerase specialized sigma24 family protein
MNRDQILSALRERILAFATSGVSRDHVEDLTQDTMAVLHEKYPLVSELTELVPLAFQVLRYKMLDAHRKAMRRSSPRSVNAKNPLRPTKRPAPTSKPPTSSIKTDPCRNSWSGFPLASPEREDTAGDSSSVEIKNGRPPDGERPFPLHRV